MKFSQIVMKSPMCSNLAACVVLISCLAYSSTLKMEAACYSETSINFYQASRCYVPEERTIRTRTLTTQHMEYERYAATALFNVGDDL
jgi:hypothetical protein